MTRRVIPVLAACLLLSGVSRVVLYAQQPTPPATVDVPQEKAGTAAKARAQAQVKTQTDDQEKEKKVQTVQGTVGMIEINQSQGPNVRIELTLTEQQGTSPTTNKTVML